MAADGCCTSSAQCCCAPIDDALNYLHIAVKALKRELLAIYYATQDKECPLASQVIAAIAVGYALSPIDLIPDFIPVLGIIDDLLLLPALLWLAIRLMPAGLMERARQRADNEPLRLAKALPAALVFGMIWLALLLWLVGMGIKAFGGPAVRGNASIILLGTGIAFAIAFAALLLHELGWRMPTLNARELGKPLLA